MASQTKKSDHHLTKHTSAPSHKHESHVMELVQKTQEHTLQMGRKTVENVLHTADTSNRLVTQSFTNLSGNLNAWMVCCNIASSTCRDISGEVMAYYNRTISNFMKTAQMAFACRTINDLIDLESIAGQKALNDYLEETNRLCEIVFDNYIKALEPIQEHTAIASDQMRKTLAA
jgi:hypothetical protein